MPKVITTSQSPDLLTGALRFGLVTARELASPGVELRRHPAGEDRATLLVHGRAIAYARCRYADGGLNAGRHDAGGHERRCLQLLADTDLVPGVLGHDDAVTWVEAVRGQRLDAVSGTMAELADICQSWGAALARLHLVPVRAAADPPRAPRPWMLDPERLPRAMRQLPATSARAAVVRIVRDDRDLLRTAARAADRWADDRWTHGDLAPDRVLVQLAPEVRVRFVDLCGAGLGDPGWDLAAAVESIVELTGGPRAPWGAASASCLADYLLRGYRRAGGPASIDAGTRALSVVARAWSAARALDDAAGHPAPLHPGSLHPGPLHPAAGRPTEVAWLADLLRRARELAARSAHPGLVAA